MRLKSNQKGFSLIEMIVVIAIIGILSGIALRMIGYLKVANTEKTVQMITKMLNKEQTIAMSKMGTTHLYVYKIDGEFYMTFSDQDLYSFNSTVMKKDSAGFGSGLKISYNTIGSGGTTTTEVTGMNFLKITYKRDGSINGSKTNCNEIIVEGSTTTKMKLVYATGKVVIKND